MLLYAAGHVASVVPGPRLDRRRDRLEFLDVRAGAEGALTPPREDEDARIRGGDLRDGSVQLFHELIVHRVKRMRPVQPGHRHAVFENQFNAFGHFQSLPASGCFQCPLKTGFLRSPKALAPST